MVQAKLIRQPWNLILAFFKGCCLLWLNCYTFLLSDLPTSSANLFITFRTDSTSQETSVTNRRVSKMVLVMNCLKKKHSKVSFHGCQLGLYRAYVSSSKTKAAYNAAVAVFRDRLVHITKNERWVAKVVKRVPKPPTYAGYMAFFFPKSPTRVEKRVRGQWRRKKTKKQKNHCWWYFRLCCVRHRATNMNTNVAQRPSVHLTTYVVEGTIRLLKV